MSDNEQKKRVLDYIKRGYRPVTDDWTNKTYRPTHEDLGEPPTGTGIPLPKEGDPQSEESPDEKDA